jgi:tRNA A37 threonylcarbamoyladenosine modification protein TsaB
MILSYFIKNNEIHLSTGDFSDMYKVPEKRLMADYIVSFVDDFLKKISNTGDKKVEALVLQKGPMSFTSHRIVNSIAKGMSMVYEDIKLRSVSSFFTYFLKASEKFPRGIICIPTMKGDYFTCEYFGYTSFDFVFASIEQIKSKSIKTFFEEDPIFDNVNLASLQLTASNSNNINAHYFVTDQPLITDYAYTTKYFN